MLTNPGASVTNSQVTSQGKPPAGLQPRTYPEIRADGAGSRVPNADYSGKGGNLATIAQTRYGAPRGWTTTAGTRTEGIAWTRPDGKVVYGAAPDVFTREG